MIELNSITASELLEWMEERQFEWHGDSDHHLIQNLQELYEKMREIDRMDAERKDKDKESKMKQNIVRRLRQYALPDPYDERENTHIQALAADAADRIEELERKNAELRETIEVLKEELEWRRKERGQVKYEQGSYCRADDDGWCDWKGCPQLRDNEPYTSRRHCPLDIDTRE